MEPSPGLGTELQWLYLYVVLVYDSQDYIVIKWITAKLLLFDPSRSDFKCRLSTEDVSQPIHYFAEYLSQ